MTLIVPLELGLLSRKRKSEDVSPWIMAFKHAFDWVKEKL
jgi:hypothetical protein